MKKEDILNNGLLEQYVLGELDVLQEENVEQYRMSDTEIASKLDSIEYNFEKLGLENAIAPPVGIKVNILTKLNNKKETNKSIAPRNNRNLWLGIAAGFAAFFLFGSVWLYTELNNVREDLKIVNDRNTDLKKDFEILSKNYSDASRWFAALSNPDAEQYVLNGNALSPNSKIVSFVNHKDKSVIINTEQLSELDDTHDYQMWADVDGEMINMGVIPKDQELIAMTYIDDAESLNITIEPSGGSDHPTVERLISNVYLD